MTPTGLKALIVETECLGLEAATVVTRNRLPCRGELLCVNAAGERVYRVKLSSLKRLDKRVDAALAAGVTQ